MPILTTNKTESIFMVPKQTKDSIYITFKGDEAGKHLGPLDLKILKILEEPSCFNLKGVFTKLKC